MKIANGSPAHQIHVEMDFHANPEFASRDRAESSPTASRSSVAGRDIGRRNRGHTNRDAVSLNLSGQDRIASRRRSHAWLHETHSESLSIIGRRVDGETIVIRLPRPVRIRLVRRGGRKRKQKCENNEQCTDWSLHHGSP